MSDSSLWHHIQRSHCIVLPNIRGVEAGGGGPEINKVSFPRILKSVECPVESFPARAKTPGRLREHFIYQHWKSKVSITQEGPEPLLWCDQCGIHMM